MALRDLGKIDAAGWLALANIPCLSRMQPDHESHLPEHQHHFQLVLLQGMLSEWAVIEAIKHIVICVNRPGRSYCGNMSILKKKVPLWLKAWLKAAILTFYRTKNETPVLYWYRIYLILQLTITPSFFFLSECCFRGVRVCVGVLPSKSKFTDSHKNG